MIRNDARALEYYYLYTDLGVTMSEIADIYGVSRQAVSKLIQRHYGSLTRNENIVSEIVEPAYYPYKRYQSYLTKFMCMVSVGNKDDCWEWQHARDAMGYGHFGLMGSIYSSHRVSYEFFKGEIPEGLYILHTCDNKRCVNPHHLYAGTQAENIADRDANYPEGYYPKRLSKKKWKRIREAREKTNLSLRELATMFNVSTPTIIKAINDDRYVDRVLNSAR